MTATHRERDGHKLLIVDAEGPPLGAAGDAIDLISQALAEGAEVIVVPAARLDPTFFHLRSGMAGEFVQKLVNYRLKFAVLGDISAAIARSDALRDFVRESNRGRDVFFLPDLDALQAKLDALA